MKIILKTLILCCFAFLVRAEVIHVPEMQKSISTALQTAAEGDTILLAPGTYTQPGLIKINKPVMIASSFIFSRNQSDIERTRISAATDDMEEWFELSAKNVRVKGIRFIGNKEHTLNITATHASVTNCQFIGGKDQLSISGGGGYIANCYFENAGDDAIDCDESISWVIEYNLIVNAHQDGIEVRLHDKSAPLTTHHFRFNEVVGSGESGIQLIDYQGNSFREFYINNNLFIGCRGAGVSCMYKEKDNTKEVYRGSLMEERAFVFNNTFSRCNYGLTISPGLLILNNIFTGITTRAIERGIYVDEDSDRSQTDYCLFFNNGVHFDDEIRTGPHNLVGTDPRLNDAYELQAGSPCIDGGINEYQWGIAAFRIPPADYAGSKPDIGAKEYNGHKWAVRQLPVLDAGKDLLLLAPVYQAHLNASMSDLSITQGNTVRLQWEKLSGPGEVIFSNHAQAETVAEFSRQGRYELQIKGISNENVLSDKLLVWIVKDFREQSAPAGKDADLLLKAADYRYLVGSAKVTGGDSEMIITAPEGREPWGSTVYQISTLTNGSYYIWVQATAHKGTESQLLVAFNDPDDEKKIDLSAAADTDKTNWWRVTFDKIPEGSYLLSIRTEQSGVRWDKIFISTDKGKQPPER